MSDFTRYDPSETIGPGRTIIEAGAGTGKTFTIAAAVTRLVAEEGVALERILVVTFTVAATAELKDRIRRRMVDTLRALQNNPAPGPPDAHMQVLLGASGERRARYAGRLDEAVTRFDRAQIFTIHGFARRLLLKLGFRSRLSGDLEPGEIDELLVRRAAADLVVARFAGSAAGGEIMTVSPAISPISARRWWGCPTPASSRIPSSRRVVGESGRRWLGTYERYSPNVCEPPGWSRSTTDWWRRGMLCPTRGSARALGIC